jgi:hypothetical protein
MSLAEIEAELEKLTSDELRRLALKSWNQFMAKEGRSGASNECNEDNPKLLAELDEAIEKAESSAAVYSADDVRARLKQWTSK